MGTIGIAKTGLGIVILVTTIAGSPVSAVLAQAGASGLVRSPVPGSQPSSALDRATSPNSLSTRCRCPRHRRSSTFRIGASTCRKSDGRSTYLATSGNAPQTGRLWNRR